MKVENGKIVEATEIELFGVYLERGFDDIMSFTEYKMRCSELGVRIVGNCDVQRMNGADRFDLSYVCRCDERKENNNA